MAEELFWKYMQYGGGESLGEPLTPLEHVEQHGQHLIVRYREFERGAIYWTSETRAYVVDEHVLRYWRNMGTQTNTLGYPTSDPIHDGGRVYNKFQYGTICYIPLTDTYKVLPCGGSARATWRSVGIFTVTALLLLVIFIFVASTAEGMGEGMIKVLPFFIGPLAAVLLAIVLQRPHDDGGT